MRESTLLLVICIAGISGQTLVNTSTGPVQGFMDGTIRTFLGIPFGESTAGEGRFSAPSAKKSWAPEVLQAIEYGPSCPQKCMLPAYMCNNNTSEDCLQLNIWAPTPTSENPGPWPVMTFLYGGAFLSGTGSVDIYSGWWLSQKDVVVVTSNYRVGVLGFLTTDILPGNYGLLDQLLMLQWIQDEIKEFGGDPSQVTLFGQSAGAMSTAIHWTTPAAWQYFDKIIMESEPFAIPQPTVSDARLTGAKFCDLIGCDYDDDDCLRNAPLDEVVLTGAKTRPFPDVFSRNFSLEWALQWQPNVDGNLIPDQVLNQVQKGIFKRIPVMLGTTQDEGILFTHKAANFIDTEEWETALVTVYGYDNAVEIDDQYPLPFDPFDNIIVNASNVVTDCIFTCPNRWVATQIAQYTPVFLYHFDHLLSFYVSWGTEFEFCWFKVCHGSELPFVFHSVTTTGAYNYTAEELVLADQFVAYWTNFAKNSDPSNGTEVLIEWPAYSNDRKIDIKLAVPVSQEEDYKDQKCNFWDTIGFYY